jgi:hypothetical protein
MRPSRPCSSVRDLISETRNTSLWNSINNYFLSIHTNRNTLYYWQYNTLFVQIYKQKFHGVEWFWEAISSAASQETPHISWNPEIHYSICITLTTALLDFVAGRLMKRKIKWWLNVSTLQPKLGCCTTEKGIVTIDDGISLMQRQLAVIPTVC